MDTPTLSQLQAYDTGHLPAGAGHVTDVAQHSDSIFSGQDSQLGALGWTGQGADAAMARVGGDARLVSATSALLHAVVSDIRTAASRLDAAHQDVMSYIQAIPKDYDVSENLTVTAKPTSEPQFIQTVRQFRAAQISTELAGKVSALVAQETSTQATLSTHAATLTGVGIPDWKPPHYDDPNHGHYNENSPTPATPYEASHHGSNFNDGVKLDTSMTRVEPDIGPQWLDAPPVRPDWPTALMSQPTPGGGSFLPKWQHDITGNSPVPQQPPLTVPTPNGPMYLLPPAGPLGSSPPLPNPNPFRNLNPAGLPPAPIGGGTVQQGITDGIQRGLPGFTPDPTTTPSYPVNHPPPPPMTNGYTGGGHIQAVDYTTPTPQPNPWTGPGGVWTQTGDPAGSVGEPPPLQDPAITDLQNRVHALQHPVCSPVDWTAHGFGLAASTTSTLFGLASAETGLGAAMALLGAGGIYWQEDALIKCYNGLE
jgi:hypothetical protein